jgi:DNA polymerase III epsilon subunit-like protein
MSFAGHDVYFSVDVEADGPIPLVHSLSSLGACVAGAFDGRAFTRTDPAERTFYAELKPVSDEFDPEAAAVAALDREQLVRDGEEPAAAMDRFTAWVRETAGEGRPVLVAYPAAFDWPWVATYLQRFGSEGSPFGFSGVLDMKTMYLVKAGVRIGKAAKRAMPAHLLSTREHTHNALDDAIEQADLFANLFEWEGG